jgi:lambda family phage portal protein
MSRLTNLIDRAVYAVSPERGLRRLNARRRAEFSDKAAEITRLRLERKRREYASGGGFQSAEQSTDAASWLKSKLSPDSSLEEDRQEMIERADSAYKNYELATSHVEGRVIRVAGCGFTIQPELDPEDLGIGEDQAEEMNRSLRKGWDRLVQRLGKHGEWLYEIQQLMQRYWERRGEFFLLFGDEYDPLSPVSLKVEVIHPDRVSTPPGKEGDRSIRLGIQLNADGKGIGCWVQDVQPNDRLEFKQTWTYYDYYLPNGLHRMMHHFDRRDARQHRGYPRMQVGVKSLKNAEEYNEAEVERNYVGSCMAAFVRTDLPTDDSMASTGVVEDSSGRRLRDIQPSMIHYIGPTDEVQFSNPTGAPATFDKFIENQDRKFAIGAGTPYEMLTGNWGNLAYNAARIIWNIDEAAVDVLQMGHCKAVLAMYQHYVTRMIATGQLKVDPVEYRDAPWLYWSVRVIPPARASIDPSREDRNDLVNVESCVQPHSDVVERKTGEPAEKIYRRIQRNRKMMEKYELEVHMPNMGRDEQGNSPTQPGDSNQPSSDANSEKQAVGA